MSATSQTNLPVLIHPHLVPANVENFEPQVNHQLSLLLALTSTSYNGRRQLSKYRCIFPCCSSSLTTIQGLVTHIYRVQGRHAPTLSQITLYSGISLMKAPGGHATPAARYSSERPIPAHRVYKLGLNYPLAHRNFEAEIIDDESEPYLIQCLELPHKLIKHVPRRLRAKWGELMTIAVWLLNRKT
jgi:hypothetical protein